MMAEMGLMNIPSPHQDTSFRMLANGWLRFEELQKKQVQSSQAFVAMWFDPSMEEPYLNGLHRAIYDSGYDPRRVDQQHHHLNKVDDEIIAEVRRSRFLVADFTCGPGKVRGGVYFEASLPWASISRSSGRVRTRRWRTCTSTHGSTRTSNGKTRATFTPSSKLASAR